MSRRFLVASLHYLCEENPNVSADFPAQVAEQLAEIGINYTETVQDVALRYDCPEHLMPAMGKFFAEKFGCRLLQPIFADHSPASELPRFMFIKEKLESLVKIDVDGLEILVGDKRMLHRETSALANALGLNLAERDNYPGGKQKVAFNLIDLSWSSINSKLPLLVF